jgi:chromosome segregation ATPase
MTPLLARATADPEWAVKMAPKAIKRLLELCAGREPRGLMRDVIKLVASLEAFDADLQEARARIDELEAKLEDRIGVQKMLDEEIDNLRERVRQLTQGKEPSKQGGIDLSDVEAK